MPFKAIPKLCALAVALFTATSALATVVTVTLTGTNENINDTSGVFGAPGGQIANQAFTQVFTIDTKGGNVARNSTTVSSNSIFGGSAPYAVAGLLTIGGHSFATAGNNYSSVFTKGDYQITSSDLPEAANLIFSLDLHGAGLPATVTAAASLAIDGTTLTALDSFIDYIPGAADAQGTLDVSNVVIAVSSVPEPATLGLAALGLGALALRTRKARVN